MKTLIMVRHAKARKDIPDIADRDRPLEKRGKKDAATIGRRLKKLKVIPDIIYSSPAERAFDTAKIVAKKIGFPVKKIKIVAAIYNASVPRLLKVIKKTGAAAESIMLFGHNPEFFELAGCLAGTPIEKFSTGAALCVALDTPSWQKIPIKRGRIVFFERP